MRDALIDYDRVQEPADPEKGLVTSVSSSASEILVPSGIDSRLVIDSTADLLLRRLTLSAIGMITLIWALTLGQAVSAESLTSRQKVPPPDSPVGIATAVRPTSSCPPVARLAKFRLWGRTSAVPHLPKPLSYDPNDEASDEPEDDDDGDCEDPFAIDNSDDLVIAWFPEFVRCFIPYEVGSAPLWTDLPLSPFLPPQRLRC